MNQEAIKEDYYQRIVKSGEGLYKEKGSKFIAHSFGVSTVAEAEEQLKALKARYHDARHWCYAYRINPRQPEVRANDDGEPNNSAGMPIFNQLQSFDVWNSLVVVVRYFGGTKLGVSGLITAYKEAARLALESSQIEEQFISETLHLRFPYSLMNEVMRVIRESDAEIVNDEMGQQAGYQVSIRQKSYPSFLEKLESMHLLEIS